jgi:hypothetical protein
MKWADCQHHVFLKKRVLHVGTSLNDSFCEGFRMPAITTQAHALGPASGSLQGRNPRNGWAPRVVRSSMAIWALRIGAWIGRMPPSQRSGGGDEPERGVLAVAALARR